jgi:hypothetical protein
MDLNIFTLLLIDKFNLKNFKLLIAIYLLTAESCLYYILNQIIGL